MRSEQGTCTPAAGHLPHQHKIEAITSIATHDQILLSALQDLITPLIRTVTVQTHQNGSTDINQRFSGAKAAVFLSALRAFISSVFIGSHPERPCMTAIDILLDKDVPLASDAQNSEKDAQQDDTDIYDMYSDNSGNNENVYNNNMDELGMQTPQHPIHRSSHTQCKSNDLEIQTSRSDVEQMRNDINADVQLYGENDETPTNDYHDVLTKRFNEIMVNDDLSAFVGPSSLNERTDEDSWNDDTVVDDTPMANTSVDILDTAEDTSFHDKFLRALRRHVFNKMPIRLLCFAPHGPHLRITLLEREDIYMYIKSIISTKMNSSEYGLRFDEEENKMETDLDAINRLIAKYAGYAIISHTWLRELPGEIIYGTWHKGQFDTQSAGYLKLVNFCKVARRDHGVTLGWIDTLCINKDSSSELDESIRLMYSWYGRAKVCIVHLAKTETLSDMHRDPWFTRGWTLQEMLAPEIIKFYNVNWDQLAQNSDNDKWQSPEILIQIEKATTITRDELCSIHLFAPLSRRMQLAAAREVTREEDIAYSLMGLFDVSMATAYGEGSKRAFSRLLQEILHSTSEGILDLFNWAGEPSYAHSPISRILPPNPKGYLHSASSKIHENKLDLNYKMRLLEPLTITHMGLRIPVLLMPGISIDVVEMSNLRPIGNYNAIVNMSPMGVMPSTYHLLDRRISGCDGPKTQGWYQCTFAVFNIEQGARGISIPEACIAIPLRCDEDAGKVTSTGSIHRIATNEAVVFELMDYGEYLYGFDIPVDRLDQDGMQLMSLYL
ncbi:hypothetical protein BDN70DRAFT_998363 [Pholiota conissans]|uniref:Heterokaryon incompatibility domain-containing protein n=1 Tax=Pholiota conissans TaxID=109636 RepID=A0A9P5YNW9_9AGAR|nr:hypothetical protein BDN70DRAFT_998363 [Pholiota conissans]